MNENEFLVAVKNLSPGLFRFFLARFDRGTAEDAVQEVLTRLLSKSSTFDSDRGNLEAFTWGVALRLQKEIQRRVRRDPHFLARLPEVPSFENEQASESDLMALKSALNGLEEPGKTVFQLHLAGLKGEQIARSLQMPEGTVKSHLFRGKESLRKILKERGSI